MNFLEETLKKLNEYGKQECNVVSVGNDKYRISWDVFKKTQTLIMTLDSEDITFVAI